MERAAPSLGSKLAVGSMAEEAQAKAAASGDDVVGFEHKFFSSFEDMFFRMSETGEPVAVIKLATNEAVLSFDGIKREFSLAADNPDGRMLDRVAEGLLYVRGMRMGDKLPKEITTREASWDPSDRHRRIAHQRLTMQLVTWLTGDELIFTSPEELAQIVNDPQVKKNINLAFAEAAEELGLGRDKKEEVIKYLETLAKELAYIEALRDMFTEIKKIDEKIQGLRKIYSSDKGLMEMVDQVARLSQRALKVFQDYFDQIDAQTGEIMSMLKNIDNQIGYIRQVRDDVHRRMMAWEDIIPIWKTVFIVKSDENANRIRDIYQFLAPRYMQVQEWTLMTKLGTEKSKPMGGMMRW